MKLSSNKLKLVIIAIASIVVVAVLGSVFVNIGMDWFNALAKPSQWIPNVVIPIVWTIIYITFAIVLYLWIKSKELPKDVIWLLIVNGVLNVLWCLVFFTLKLTFVGNIVIVVNLIAGWLLLWRIWSYHKPYAYATLIYPIWLSLATTLNLALWILN